MKIFFFFFKYHDPKKFHSYNFTIWAVSLQLHSDIRGQGVIKSAIVILQESRWGQNLVHNQKGICCWVLQSWFQCLIRIFRSDGEKCLFSGKFADSESCKNCQLLGEEDSLNQLKLQVCKTFPWSINRQRPCLWSWTKPSVSVVSLLPLVGFKNRNWVEPLRIHLILSRTIFVLWPNNPDSDVHRADFLWLALWTEKMVKQSNEKMFEDRGRLIIYSKEELIGQDIDKSVEEERTRKGWKTSVACYLHSVSVSIVYQGSWGERRVFQIIVFLWLVCNSFWILDKHVLCTFLNSVCKQCSLGKTFSKKVSYFILLTVVALCCFVWLVTSVF